MISTASRFNVHRSFTDPSALRAPSPSPDVRLGSLTLMRHKMTFSHFSKGFIRPNLGEESECGLLAVSEFQVSADIPPLSRDTARRVRNIHDINLCIGGHGMPCPYKPMCVICYLLSVLCHP